jgi:hypothetical protein
MKLYYQVMLIIAMMCVVVSLIAGTIILWDIATRTIAEQIITQVINGAY